MKYRILEQSDNNSIYYIVQYKEWGLWWDLKVWDNLTIYSFTKYFKTVEEAEKDVLAFFKFKHNQNKKAIKKEGELK